MDKRRENCVKSITHYSYQVVTNLLRTELLQMTDSKLSTQMKPLINLTKSAINIQNCSVRKTN